MSDNFTVVLDLSRVKNDKKKNQSYIVMADTTKMKMIYEFQLYIQFLFSLDCSVELFHEDVRLPDLEDIRVLSHLGVIQVRPAENVEEKKCEGIKLISKLKGSNEKHGDGGTRPMPGDIVTSYNYTDSQKNVCNFKSVGAGKIAQAQEVSRFNANKKAEMFCSPLFLASDKACSAVQQPKDHLRKVCNMQEKTFRLGEKIGMAENLKLGTLLQNRYYGWSGKPESNITDSDHGVENRSYISNDLKPGNVKISRSTFDGTMLGSANLKETKNHELCVREPPAHEIRSKNFSTGRPDPHYGPCGSHAIPGAVHKPLTNLTANPPEKKSCAEGNISRKPLSVEEALKMLTEAAAQRSKTLSGKNPAYHNDGKKNQLRGVSKTSKAIPVGGSQNFQKGNFKPQTKPKNPGTLDKDGAAQVILGRHNGKVVKSQCQCNVPKKETKKSKVNKMAEKGDKNQGNALLEGCEKLDKKQGTETASIVKFKGKTVVPNPNLQCNTTKKKIPKVNNTTETGDKSQGKASAKGCEKISNCHGQKTGNTGEVEWKPGELEALLQCSTTKKIPKVNNTTETGDKSQGKASAKGCEKISNCHGQKTGNTGEVEWKPGEPEALLQCKTTKIPKVNNTIETGDKSEINPLFKGSEKIDENHGRNSESTRKVEAKIGAPNLLHSDPAQNIKKRKKKKKTKCENKTVTQSLLRDSEHFDNNDRNDKIPGAGKTETETAPSNPFLKYGNVENEIVPGDGFGEFSTTESAFLEELCSLALNEIIKEKAINDGESAGFEKSPSREINSSMGDSEPGVGVRCQSPDNPTGVDISVKERSDFRFPESDSRKDLEMTDRPLDNTEDGNGANVSNSLANSFGRLRFWDGAVKQDVVAPPFTDPEQRNTNFGADTSPNGGDRDKSESHSGLPVTDRVITQLNAITDNARAEDTQDINVTDTVGNGRFVSSQGLASLTRSQSRDGFRTECDGALPGVATKSIRVGGAKSDSSGSSCVQTNEAVAVPCPSVKNEESQDLHEPEGSGRDTKIEQLPNSRAGSSGESANVRTGNDSGSDVAGDAVKKDRPPFSKECVIALVMIITALAF